MDMGGGGGFYVGACLAGGWGFESGGHLCGLFSIPSTYQADIWMFSLQHHSSTIQIHITINTSKIPGRKGVGNKPFVFVAYGRGFSHLPGQNEEEEFDFDAPVERVEASRWNSHEAFDRYLVREGERENVNGPKPDATVDVEDGFDPDKSDMVRSLFFAMLFSCG